MNKNILKITTILSSLIILPAVSMAEPTATKTTEINSGINSTAGNDGVEFQNSNVDAARGVEASDSPGEETISRGSEAYNTENGDKAHQAKEVDQGSDYTSATSSELIEKGSAGASNYKTVTNTNGSVSAYGDQEVYGNGNSADKNKLYIEGDELEANKSAYKASGGSSVGKQKIMTEGESTTTLTKYNTISHY